MGINTAYRDGTGLLHLHSYDKGLAFNIGSVGDDIGLKCHPGSMLTYLAKMKVIKVRYSIHIAGGVGPFTFGVADKDAAEDAFATPSKYEGTGGGGFPVHCGYIASNAGNDGFERQVKTWKPKKMAVHYDQAFFISFNNDETFGTFSYAFSIYAIGVDL